MKQYISPIINARELSPGFWLKTVRTPEIASEAQPGQFVHVKVSLGPHPLLRRPFSILDVNRSEGTWSFLYKVVGEGTEILSQRMEGEMLDILGPIGTSFSGNDKPALLVAGGIGMAPLHFLAGELEQRQIPVTFIYGAGKENELVMSEQLFSRADKVILVTEDGSRGEKGNAVDAASLLLDQDFAIYACGPDPMLAAFKKELTKHEKTAQFSLENYMACGTGACQGCVVKIGSEYKRVCVDGPVFSSDEIQSFKGETKDG